MKFIITLMLLISTDAFASRIKFGVPELSGRGCPTGAVTTALAPDQSSFAIIFDQYTIQAPKGSAKPLSKDCKFKIPVAELPPGQTLRAMWIDYRGFISVPKNVFAEIKTTNRVWTIDNDESPPVFSTYITSNINLPMESEFFKKIRSNQNFPRKCNNNSAIEISTEMILSPNAIRQGGRYRYIPLEKDAIFALDSADGGPIRIGIDLEPCDANACTPGGAVLEEDRWKEKPDSYTEWEDDRCCTGKAMHGGRFDQVTCYYNWRD